MLLRLLLDGLKSPQALLFYIFSETCSTAQDLEVCTLSFPLHILSDYSCYYTCFFFVLFFFYNSSSCMSLPKIVKHTDSTSPYFSLHSPSQAQGEAGLNAVFSDIDRDSTQIHMVVLNTAPTRSYNRKVLLLFPRWMQRRSFHRLFCASEVVCYFSCTA